MTDNHPIVECIRHGALEAIKEKMLWSYRQMPSTEEHLLRQRQLEQWPYAITAPLNERGHIMGFLALQEKISGDMFNDEDLSLLRGLSRPAATALRNTRRMVDLEEQEKALQQKHEMMLMGVLATEMAHELSKPLTHIVNTGSRLESILKQPAHEGLAKIERAARRASDILDSFVMLSPLTDLQRHQVSLSQILDEAIEVLGIDEDTSICIEKHYEKLAPVEIHAGQIAQVCTNVLQNAWQAMPAGGCLKIVLRKVVSSINKEILMIEVEDNGEGIAQDVLPHIFDPFFTTKKDIGGRGVGLTLSHAMIERHGGTLFVESPIHMHRGTRVSIKLPLEMKGIAHAAPSA